MGLEPTKTPLLRRLAVPIYISHEGIFELREGFEPTYHGFADRDFTNQTPELELAAVVICRSCCYLVIWFYIYLIT